MLLPPYYIQVGPRNDGKFAPADYLHLPEMGIKGWYQEGVRRRKVKPYYHLVWPKDKDRGNFGRLKDILQGKGPAIHLSISAQKNDHATNRPLHGRWTHWEDLDSRFDDPYNDDWPGQYSFKGPCWVSDGSKKYNFYTRKYEDYHPKMWTDAIWQGPHKNTKWPDQYRRVTGTWQQDINWKPYAPFQKMSKI